MKTKFKPVKAVVKAIDGSIKKWEKVMKGEIEDEGRDNCPLCKRSMVLTYRKKFGISKCSGCPIFCFTKKEGCRGTPYLNFCFSRCEYCKKLIRCSKCRVLAKKMINFIKMIKRKYLAGKIKL